MRSPEPRGRRLPRTGVLVALVSALAILGVVSTRLFRSAEPLQRGLGIAVVPSGSVSTSAGAASQPHAAASAAYPVGADALQVLPGGECALAVRLTRLLAAERPDSNFVWSPHALARGLSIVALGANTATAQEILEVLAFRGTSIDLARHLAALEASLVEHTRDGKKYSYESGAALFAERVDPEFRKDLRFFPGLQLHDYAGPYSRDFERRMAAIRINQMAREKTRGRIDSILPPAWLPEASPRESVASVLVTTMFLAGGWHERAEVTWGDFARAGRRSSQEFVVFGGFQAYLEESEALSLSVPLSGGGIRAHFVLTRDPAVELERAPLAIGCERNTSRGEWIDVSVPRFRAKSTINLKKLLGRLGVVRAFDPDHAGLRVSGAPRNWIDEIPHAASIELNRHGIGVSRNDAEHGLRVGTKRSLILDRPYFFFVIGPYGQVLLAGRVTDPSGGDTPNATLE